MGMGGPKGPGLLLVVALVDDETSGLIVSAPCAESTMQAKIIESVARATMQNLLVKTGLCFILKTPLLPW